MLSYGISNPFQPGFGPPLIFFSTTYGLMDIIDPHRFIDVGLFVKSAVQISDACYKKKQDGATE